jgi:hypothetical protein
MMMPAKQQNEPAKPADRPKLDSLNDFIQEQVMQVLGKPTNLIKVQVRQLWDNHYRVNVLVGLDAASARVANSYFLVVNSEGNVITANPKLGSQYKPV